MDDLAEDQGINLGQVYVKSTYDAIAEDFSATRYKKWPKVDLFLQSLACQSLLLDIGCGNGKYLNSNLTFNIGCDLSLNLLRICKSRGFEVVFCDMTKLPFRAGIFDAVICVAALHHITTYKRRQQCLADITELIHPREGKCLVQVWSFEQQLGKSNPYLKSHVKKSCEERDKFNSDKVRVADQVELPIHKNRTPFVEQDILVPFHSKTKVSLSQKSDGLSTSGQPQLRYYHVFREGELDQMFSKLANIKILESYYDKGNWCIVAGKSTDWK